MVFVLSIGAHFAGFYKVFLSFLAVVLSICLAKKYVGLKLYVSIFLISILSCYYADFRAPNPDMLAKIAPINTNIEGTVEKTLLTYIIRDHDRDRFERRKKEIQHLANKINAEYGENTAVVELRDQYYNMREKVEPVMHVVDLAFEAMNATGVKPNVKPIRGGTDGARLSFEGLPCPNIFAGGHNFHGRFEYLPIPSMEKAMMVIVKIAELLEQKS